MYKADWYYVRPLVHLCQYCLLVSKLLFTSPVASLSLNRDTKTTCRWCTTELWLLQKILSVCLWWVSFILSSCKPMDHIHLMWHLAILILASYAKAIYGLANWRLSNPWIIMLSKPKILGLSLGSKLQVKFRDWSLFAWSLDCCFVQRKNWASALTPLDNKTFVSASEILR